MRLALASESLSCSDQPSAAETVEPAAGIFFDHVDGRGVIALLVLRIGGIGIRVAIGEILLGLHTIMISFSHGYLPWNLLMYETLWQCA